MAKAKPTKVTKDELLELQNIVKMVNNAQMDIGNLEIQKASAISAAFEFRGNLVANQKKLKEKYGDVNINITDGTIKGKENGKVNT
tara:strand:+ start:2330 stop:2587 length:258 start_codon:yes stop_codon:yes gene_type:complete